MRFYFVMRELVDLGVEMGRISEALLNVWALKPRSGDVGGYFADGRGVGKVFMWVCEGLLIGG